MKTKNDNYNCIKCNSNEYEKADTRQYWYMPHVGGFFKKNFSGNAKFTIISCLNCGYAEYYKKKRNEKDKFPTMIIVGAAITMGAGLIMYFFMFYSDHDGMHFRLPW